MFSLTCQATQATGPHEVQIELQISSGVEVVMWLGNCAFGLLLPSRSLLQLSRSAKLQPEGIMNVQKEEVKLPTWYL